MSVRDHGPTPTRIDAAAPRAPGTGVHGDDPDLRAVLLFAAVALPGIALGPAVAANSTRRAGI
jgi:hypothetical protein